MIILEENFIWHLEAFASELFICRFLNNLQYLIQSLEFTAPITVQH